jgi:hypothetical protein
MARKLLAVEIGEQQKKANNKLIKKETGGGLTI